MNFQEQVTGALRQITQLAQRGEVTWNTLQQGVDGNFSPQLRELAEVNRQIRARLEQYQILYKGSTVQIENGATLFRADYDVLLNILFPDTGSPQRKAAEKKGMHASHLEPFKIKIDNERVIEFQIQKKGVKIVDLLEVGKLRSLQVLGVATDRISELDGLEKHPSLSSLSIFGNSSIKDFGLLASIPDLKHLRFFDCDLSVQGMQSIFSTVQLKDLDLGPNRVETVTGIEALVNLEKLSLWANPIRDLSPISGLAGLKHLKLKGLSAKDLNPLLACEALQVLEISKKEFCGSPYYGWLIGGAGNLRVIRVLQERGVKVQVLE